MSLRVEDMPLRAEMRWVAAPWLVRVPAMLASWLMLGGFFLEPSCYDRLLPELMMAGFLMMLAGNMPEMWST